MKFPNKKFALVTVTIIACLLFFIHLFYRWAHLPDPISKVESFQNFNDICVSHNMLLPNINLLSHTKTSFWICLSDHWKWSPPDGYKISSELSRANGIGKSKLSVECNYDYANENSICNDYQTEETYGSIQIFWTSGSTKSDSLPSNIHYIMSDFKIDNFIYHVALYTDGDNYLEQEAEVTQIREVVHSIIDSSVL